MLIIMVYNIEMVENAALFDGWWLAFDGCCSVPMGTSPRKLLYVSSSRHGV